MTISKLSDYAVLGKASCLIEKYDYININNLFLISNVRAQIPRRGGRKRLAGHVANG